MTLLEAFSHPKVLLLAAAYFCSTSANYSLEFFLPSILQQWYSLDLNAITWLVILPPALALASQLFVGWNSDRTRERRLHAVVPICLGMIALARLLGAAQPKRTDPLAPRLPHFAPKAKSVIWLFMVANRSS